MNEWQRFGDPSKFAIEFGFVPDPHAGQASRPGPAASWGGFRLWLRDRNLCAHQAQGKPRTEVTWYLLPLFRWLAENWDPLFHEHRLPEVIKKAESARHAYRLGLRATLGDPDFRVERRAEIWQRWWQRHALRSCRDGGLFPDVFIRRMLDFVEISWGNQALPGAPSGFYFTAPFDTVYLEVDQVVEPLYQALEAATRSLSRAGGTETAEIAALHRAVKRIPETGPDERERWYLYGEPDPQTGIGPIRFRYPTVLETLREKVRALAASTHHPLCLRQLSPAAAMFGSATPAIGQADAELLARTLLSAFTRDPEPTAHDPLVRNQPLTGMRADYEEGYDLALDLLDAIGLPGEQAQSIDTDHLLRDLEIAVSTVEMEDSALRGAALAGPDLRPTILVNIRHPKNQQASGRRFTIAHELCHVLHDRDYARRVSLVSGPWAPPGVERRANAFAAMLLMPPELVNRLVADLPSSDLASVDAIRGLARRMGTGFLATLKHLTNIGKLDDGERERVEAEAWRRMDFDA
ncbi:MAG: ImmA/IrrE family metallo-endopeptidase [Candidatus Thiosymbion ectosymbiont of Robbea hypermnestra]|nr:ImmA/IrrE family metallo-endopeptidase [Candidatus Thiosymbion ectosymbiont of Robbea hypermnestra]